jgi:hypothetical protein
MLKLRWFIPALLITLTVSSTLAQQCLSIVNEALERAGDECLQTKRNEICYGYNNIVALPNVDPDTFDFDEHGDIALVDEIEVMELSPFNEENEEWGIAIGRLQAQLPDTLPGQNVTIVFFGGVSVQNGGVNDEGVQAFRFETGIGTERCLGLPPDGIIIETPEDSTILTFDINGTEITLGSTAFLQTFAEEGSSEPMLRVGMLEGLAFITAQGETTRITDGEQTIIPLDTNLNAVGMPEPASEFDSGTLDIMEAFLEGLEFENGETAEETTGLPCMVSTGEESSAGLRVGPGLNRTMRTWLIPNRQVTVTGISDDGEWWQVDKYEAFPSGANSVVELWVRVDEVTATGDCSLIGTADAPSIIAPPQGITVSPTPHDDEERIVVVTEELNEPIVTYWVEDIDDSSGSEFATEESSFEFCSNINWYIEYVSAMYLVGDGSQPVPLAGIRGSYEVCPHVTTTYYIRVVYSDGSQEDFPVVVHRAG